VDETGYPTVIALLGSLPERNLKLMFIWRSLAPG
jgi:hypothetical protein